MNAIENVASDINALTGLAGPELETITHMVMASIAEACGNDKAAQHFDRRAEEVACYLGCHMLVNPDLILAVKNLCADPADFASEQECCHVRVLGSRWLRKHGHGWTADLGNRIGWKDGHPAAIPIADVIETLKRN